MAALKRISILGVTGSIGQSTADVILSAPGTFDVQAVTANAKVDELAAIAIRLNAKFAVIGDSSKLPALEGALNGTNIRAAAGDAALLDAAAMPADIIMCAIVGCAGLLPVLTAIAQGTCVAIANKEPLVVAGNLVTDAARKSGAKILPVDSEHNAVFQVFDEDNRAGISRIILTASGGPFRGRKLSDLAAITPAQAVKHPNWSMGAKISVDSATMMNKALEVIEAHILFAMPPEKIDVVIHPQSVIHSMVEYADGSILAQLGAPDMRTPIAYALAWPARMATPGQRLDLKTLSRLDFEDADHALYPALRLAYEALRLGQGACLALNVANEVAVDAFMAGKITFPAILRLNEDIMCQYPWLVPETLEETLQMVETVRAKASAYIVSMSNPEHKASG